MAKLKIKVTPNSSLEEIEEAIEDVLNCGQQEIELKILIKIAESLGAVHITGRKGGTGSKQRFKYKGFVGIGGYEDGIFRVDSIHGGKGNIKVLMVNVKRYFMPHINRIIVMKRAER